MAHIFWNLFCYCTSGVESLIFFYLKKEEEKGCFEFKWSWNSTVTFLFLPLLTKYTVNAKFLSAVFCDIWVTKMSVPATGVNRSSCEEELGA